MENNAILKLEAKCRQLIACYQQVQQENRELKQQLTSSRKKQHIATQRVSNVLQRLKQLDMA
jgi:hypothetical protein